MPEFGKLQTVDLHKVWPHEARDFTPWLAENIGALGESLGMEIELTKSEADVGEFTLDLLAKDLSNGRNVIIENQLGSTDHDHLGKLLTYAAGYDAVTIIWVAQSIRGEHRRTLEWLNQRTNEETHFFGVVVEVLQIDNSKLAFNFKPVVFPIEWPPKTTTALGESYRRFFQVLIDELREKHKFTSARVSQPYNGYMFSSGFRGVGFSAGFPLGGRVRVEAYISLGEATQTKSLFDKLMQSRSEIEAAFGEPLEWERLDERKGSRVASYFSGSIMDTADQLVSIRQEIIDRLLRLKKSLGPSLQKYVGQNPMLGEDA